MTRPPAGRRPGSDGGLNWAKALVLIVVLVIIGVLILKDTGKGTPSARTGGSHATTTTTATTVPVSTSTTTLLPPAQVKVQVLNGANFSQPLASEWTAKLKARPGYTMEPGDNATSTVAASTIYVVTPGYLPEAEQLAATVGISNSAIVSSVPTNAPIKASERSTANLILVVGPDLAATA
jgi:hypothetical protein